MITTVKKASQMLCEGGGNGKCAPLVCMKWEFWTDPVGGKLKMSETKHGIKDADKLGYCGLSQRR
jgi:hypothetical protein